MTESQLPESKPDLSAIIAPHLGTPGRGLEGDVEILRQSIFNQRVAAEQQAALGSPQGKVDARTIQEQSLAARRAEGGSIKLWHIALGTTALAGVLFVGKYIVSQPAQAEQLPVSPAPVSTQGESGGLFDKIPGYTEFSDALGNRSNGSTTGK